jgi:hypothetical protein
VLSVLGDWSLQVSLVFLAAFAVCLRTKSPSIRKNIWFVGVIVALAQPLGLLIPTRALRVGPGPHYKFWSQASPSPAWLWVWAAGSILVLAGIVASHFALARCVRKSRCEPGFGGRASVSGTAWPRTPLAYGMIRAKVLLPRESRGWSPDRIDSVLLHEEAHVRARDPLALLLSHLVCAALWFHPLPWLAAAKLRVECELAADEAVVRAGVVPSVYAKHLLDCARGSPPLSRSNQIAAVAMVREPGIEQRIKALLRAKVGKGLSPLHRVAFAVAALSLFLATRAAVAQSLDKAHSAEWFRGYRAAAEFQSGHSSPRGIGGLTAEQMRALERAEIAKGRR